MTTSSFKEFWPSVGQTIGEAASKVTWDHQQKRIEEIKMAIARFLDTSVWDPEYPKMRQNLIEALDK